MFTIYRSASRAVSANIPAPRAFSMLSYEVFKSSTTTAPPTKTIVCLHGILGSKKNWRTPSNIFTKKHPEFYAIAMDHRGHGMSPPTLPGDNTVESCAVDVLQTLQSKSLPPVFNEQLTILCGHSFSGKVVLYMLDQMIKNNTPLPEHVWVLDSLPGAYDKEHDKAHRQSVVGIIETICALPAEFESKQWIENHLVAKGFIKPIIDWLSTNIIPVTLPDGTATSPAAFRYSFDVNTVQELFDDFCHLEKWDFLENYSGSAKIHFIQAGKNPAWTPEVIAKFAELTATNPNIKHHIMPHVGHWLHAEDVNGLITMIATHSSLAV